MTRYRNDRQFDDRDSRFDREGYGQDRYQSEGRRMDMDRDFMSQDRSDFRSSDDMGRQYRQGGMDQGSYGQGYGQDYGQGRQGMSGSGMDRDYGRSDSFQGSMGMGRQGQSYGSIGQGSYGQGQYGQDYSQGRQGMSSYGMDRDYGRSGSGQGSMGGMGMGGSGQDYGQGRQGMSGYGMDRDYGRSDSFQGGMGMGQMGGQSHYGKGPKGHQRSDERIKEEVSDALQDDHSVDASEIEVKVESGEVTLTGTVSDRQQKRAAESCAERVRGVKDVHNQIRMAQSDMSSQGGMSQTSGTATSGMSTSNTKGSTTTSGS